VKLICDRVWTIPGLRMKSGREHRVPLSDRAVAIRGALEHLPDNPHVFPGAKQGKRLSPRTLPVALGWMQDGVTQDGVTVHGFRSSFRTWAAERTNYPVRFARLRLDAGWIPRKRTFFGTRPRGGNEQQLFGMQKQADEG
jgi:integrase